MRNRNKALLVLAAAAAIPTAAKAVVITYSIDPSDFQISTTFAGALTPIPVSDIASSGGSTVITLPAADQGDFIKFGVDAALTSATGGTATGLTVGGVAATPTGIGQVYFGIANSNPSFAAIAATAASNASGATVSSLNPNSGLWSSFNKGKADGVGGVSLNSGFTVSQNAGGPANPSLTAQTEVARNISIGVLGSSGSSIFTITPTNGAGNITGTQYIATQNSGSTPSSQFDSLGTGDSVGAFPTLKVIIAGATSSTSAQGHAIISLSAGTAAVANYGNADGSLTMTGLGNGSYNVAHDTAFTTSATASVPVTGFNPATDKEIYALKLSLPNGVTDAEVIADINGGGTNVAAVGVTASAVTGVYSTLFPGYDILLTSVGGFTATGGASLGFDFTADTTSADAGITVTGVAAVPEPATAAGIVLGAAGMLLGRRRNKAVVA